MQKTTYFLLLFVMASLLACGDTPEQNDTAKMETVSEPMDPALALIDEMLDAMGGMDQFREVRDVSYTYTKETPDGPNVISEEVYLFPGEWSWAKYEDAKNPTNEDEKGTLVQGYANDKAWVKFNGESVTNEKALQRARFSRKTNLYWLSMFFKMRDPGLTYELDEVRTVESQNYQTVKVSFEDNVGDAKDIYFLYINEDTKLVDYFLFTVMEFDRAEPIMMQVEYEKVAGLQWPTTRRSVGSNWDGDIREDAEWSSPTVLRDLRVNTGVKQSLFLP